MALQVTVKLSEQLYRQVQQMAQREQKDVPEAITAYLEHHLLSEETLTHQTFPQTDPDPGVEQERAAYLQLHAELWQKHPGKYVAIYQGELVDYDPDKNALLGRIEKMYPTQFVLVRRVEAEPELIYTFHSTRFSQDP